MGDEKSLLNTNTHTQPCDLLQNIPETLCQIETFECPEINLVKLIPFTSCQESEGFSEFQ